MGSQPKKLGIIAPKAENPRKLVKSLVNPDYARPGTLWGSDELKNWMGHL